jgi:hypothetical protein
MALGEITVLCEGQLEGRDIRWLGLALDAAGLSRSIDVTPAGSKTNLKPTILGLRQSLQTRRVYALRDRDFLTTDLLTKDLDAGICPLRRHCLESYLLEPLLLESAFGITGIEKILTERAGARLFLDVARASVEDFAFSLRGLRPSFDSDAPRTIEEAVEAVQRVISEFIAGLVAPDAATLTDRFAKDMQADRLWTRVDGKALLGEIEQYLRGSVLPGGDIEGRLFKWCATNGPPSSLVEDVRHALGVLSALPPAIA